MDMIITTVTKCETDYAFSSDYWMTLGVTLGAIAVAGLVALFFLWIFSL
jgi:hypothetical protein